jgi:hypothetical protein
VSKHAPIAAEAVFEAIRERLEAEFERGNGRASDDPEERFSLPRQ